MTIKFILALLLVSTSFLPSGAISMQGVKINDPKQVLEKLSLERISTDQNMQKFRTENGNDFSVTVDKGKIVYMENDWLQEEKGTQALFSDFSFGKTSLKDIRLTFASNGFTYSSRGMFRTPTDVIMFNCYEFDSENNEVLVTITKVSLKEEITEKNLASKAKLDALIIAEKSYLDKTWGKEKVFDPKYKKIKA
ncbi:MAG: hypothetical protein ACKOXP_03380 [Flavobacteriales bacterium]